MYLVIADDLTGAAELGGVAHRYGLGAEVVFRQIPPAADEVVAVVTDTRSKPAEEAASDVASLVRRWKGPADCKIYKKVDSVLRGPVIAELSATMEVLGRRRALLVPCNPGLGRIIHSGRYWVEGRPIHETDFGEDPDHPIHTSEVLAILKAPPGSPTVQVVPAGGGLAPSGITVGEARTSGDVREWAERLDAGTLPAGAAEFFGAILERDGLRAKHAIPHELPDTETLLLVSGSASARSREQTSELERRGVPVFRMPRDLLINPAEAHRLMGNWTDLAVTALARKGRAMVSIGQPVEAGSRRSTRLASLLGKAAETIVARFPVQHLWVEGGATASALVHRLGWHRMHVECELAPGAVQLRPHGQTRPLILLKPGSYRWPSCY